MSSNATFGQAGHTLTIIGQQEPTTEHLKMLHDGYLADLMRAIMNSSLPDRPNFQKFLGLLPELKVWKTIKLGLHKSPAEYRMALEATYRISVYADQILEKVSIAKVETEVDLVRMTVAELGFKGVTRYDVICKRVVEIGGLIDESGEVGPALREQYPDQPYGEWNTVVMKAIADSDGVLKVFGVVRGSDGRWLYAHYGCPVSLFNPGSHIVFRVPRK